MASTDVEHEPTGQGPERSGAGARVRETTETDGPAPGGVEENTGAWAPDGHDADPNLDTAPEADLDADAGEPAPVLSRRERLRRRVVRTKRELVREISVRVVGWDTIEVSLLRGLRPRRYRLDDERADRVIKSSVLRIHVPEPTYLGRLAAAGLLRGGVREIRVHIDRMPTWLRGGLQLPRVSRDSASVSWRERGAGIEVRYTTKRRRPLGRGLAELAAAVVRPGRWEQAGGPIYALDRGAWLAGTSTYPHGLLGVPPAQPDPAAQPDPTAQPDPASADAQPVVTIGPFTAPPAAMAPGHRWALGTAVANPYGRRLLKSPRQLYLRRDGDRLVAHKVVDGASYLVFSPDIPVEASLLSRRWDKYSVLDLGSTWPAWLDDSPGDERFTRFFDHVLDALCACGVVLASSCAPLRERVRARGLPCVGDPSIVDGLDGYQLSAQTARHAVILGDQALRHTSLVETLELGTRGPGARVAAPSVSVLVASKRPEDLRSCLRRLAAQTYPSFEVVIGTHGYVLDDAAIDELRATLTAPVRVLPVPAELTLGEVLGRLSRHADGDVLTKVDDDDPYGPDHLTDLVLAWRTTGADLVAKSARFVHFADLDTTIDRTWATLETFDVTPAGGTFLLPRGALLAAGGWSTSPRRVDADLLARVRNTGGVTYRTHGLGYVYVRRGHGHTFQANHSDLFAQAGAVWDGIPSELLQAGGSGAGTEAKEQEA